MLTSASGTFVVPTVIVSVLKAMAQLGFGSVKSCRKSRYTAKKQKKYAARSANCSVGRQPGRLLEQKGGSIQVSILRAFGQSPGLALPVENKAAFSADGLKADLNQSLYGGSKTPLTTRPSSRSAPACGCMERASSSSPSQAVVTASRSAFLPMKAGQEGCIAGTR